MNGLQRMDMLVPMVWMVSYQGQPMYMDNVQETWPQCANWEANDIGAHEDEGDNAVGERLLRALQREDLEQGGLRAAAPAFRPPRDWTKDAMRDLMARPGWPAVRRAFGIGMMIGGLLVLLIGYSWLGVVNASHGGEQYIKHEHLFEKCMASYVRSEGIGYLSSGLEIAPPLGGFDYWRSKPCGCGVELSMVYVTGVEGNNHWSSSPEMEVAPSFLDMASVSSDTQVRAEGYVKMNLEGGDDLSFEPEDAPLLDDYLKKLRDYGFGGSLDECGTEVIPYSKEDQSESLEEPRKKDGRRIERIVASIAASDHHEVASSGSLRSSSGSSSSSSHGSDSLASRFARIVAKIAAGIACGDCATNGVIGLAVKFVDVPQIEYVDKFIEKENMVDSGVPRPLRQGVATDSADEEEEKEEAGNMDEEYVEKGFGYTLLDGVLFGGFEEYVGKGFGNTLLDGIFFESIDDLSSGSQEPNVDYKGDGVDDVTVRLCFGGFAILTAVLAVGCWPSEARAPNKKLGFVIYKKGLAYELRACDKMGMM